MLRKGLLALLLGGLSLPAAAAAQATEAAPTAVAPAPLMQSPADAMTQDARDYAARHEVSLADARARLWAQQESAAATDLLRAEFQDRLAGISIEHKPEYRIVVLLTGSEPVPSRTLRTSAMAVPVVFQTNAAATREQVVAAIDTHQAAIRASLKAAPGMGLDPRTGELVVIVHALDLAREGEGGLDARLEALTGVPVRIRPQGLEHQDAVAGGGRVEGPAQAGGQRAVCTTGFVVTDGARTGIATAAHCPDDLNYRDSAEGDVPLTFVGQWGWRYRDVQIHESGQAEQPIFYADPEKRSARRLSTWRNRASTRAGDTVCHRGETTGYSCSEVELTDYAPPGDLCGGPCAPAWVTVRGPSCKGGDSGGPVFLGSVAFGLLKGASYARSGRCDFYYYMSTDYLPEGWSLLR
jgi:hypothetical protein